MCAREAEVCECVVCVFICAHVSVCEGVWVMVVCECLRTCMCTCVCACLEDCCGGGAGMCGSV